MISKAATDTRTAALPIRFTPNARSAWGSVIRHVARTTPVSVLLPAYIGYTDREGSGVFDPVQEARVPFELYRVTDNLAPDLDDFLHRVRSGRVTIALLIHYFGMCRTDVAMLREECRARGVVFAEDCAHVLPGRWDSEPLGATGDFAFYSLHKHLAVESGGLLRWNDRAGAAEMEPDLSAPPPSVLERYAVTDLHRVAAVRRANFQSYLEQLSASDCESMFTLERDDIPQTFPMRVPGPKRREKLYFYLMDRGMPTIALYYRLIDAIGAEEFPLSHRISNEILNLPVHQDTTPDDVGRLCDAIRTFLRCN